jgi:hypothetical protein
MKKFKEFIIEKGYFSRDLVTYAQTKNKDDSDGYDPVSDGERNFKSFHKVNTQVTDYPEAEEGDQSGSKKISKTTHTEAPGKGETEVKQGSSDVNVEYRSGLKKNIVNKANFGGKKTASTPRDKTGGETAMNRLKKNDVVDTPPYGVKEETELQEGVVDTLKKIVANKKPMTVTFQNGKTLPVDLKTASSLLSAHGKLNPDNQEKFRDHLEKGTTTFMKMIDFANR